MPDYVPYPLAEWKPPERDYYTRPCEDEYDAMAATALYRAHSYQDERDRPYKSPELMWWTFPERTLNNRNELWDAFDAYARWRIKHPYVVIRKETDERKLEVYEIRNYVSLSIDGFIAFCQQDLELFDNLLMAPDSRPYAIEILRAIEVDQQMFPERVERVKTC